MDSAGSDDLMFGVSYAVYVWFSEMIIVLISKSHPTHLGTNNLELECTSEKTNLRSGPAAAGQTRLCLVPGPRSSPPL